MDEADQADEVVAHNLKVALDAIRAKKVEKVDAVMVVCGSCDYSAIVKGLDCQDWEQCVSDCRKFGVLR